MIRSLPLLAVAASCSLLAASCAPTTEGAAADGAAPASAAASGRQCFTPDRVRNFRQGPQVGQIFVRSDTNQVFELNSAGGCTNLDFAVRMTIVAEGAGLAGGRTCVGDSVRIVTPGRTAATSTCRARVNRILTAEEVAALPASQRP